MAGSSSDESGVGQQLSGEALAEWRSSEQLENGIASTSPPYWDNDDDDCGPKPSDLYGKHTWKIDKFSQINKRELRSNAFERVSVLHRSGQFVAAVFCCGWYILIYPQGCDVCNHLSLFLCVANHDKLLPGWSHFAQFTIAVVNKDPKKSKYSDTLHRFWKKEHDWGWKKFMELSKVVDGFVDAGTLIIKAQVQVIRERVDRPFRCLDCQYRRELVRVYLSNVEQICRRFVEDRRGRLVKLIEDKVRWSSFCTFWLGIDQSVRCRMSREKSDSILKIAVKHFFIEKEVTSTLVMDSLYSGLKALEGQIKNKKAKGKCLDVEQLPTTPIVWVEKDMFVLVDDVLLLLERVALEPLPPKDDKGPQNRTKDGGPGEDFSKDSIEHDERRLTELGCRTIEIFVLSYIFSKIEVAYQEFVSLIRQEELIREEEEEAWMTGIERKAKRGASVKEKKSKKKQGKQKRNNHKLKDKVREEKTGIVLKDKSQQQNPVNGDITFLIEDAEKCEDGSDVSDSVSCLTTVHNGRRKSPSTNDSSSTCTSDSLPSMVMNLIYKGNSLQNQKNKNTPKRGKDKHGKPTGEVTAQANRHSHVNEPKSDEGVSLQKEASVKDQVVPKPLKENTASSLHHKADLKKTTAIPRSPPSDKTVNNDKTFNLHKTGTQKPTEKAMNGSGTWTIDTQPEPSVSRPLSAPLVPVTSTSPSRSPSPTAVSIIQAAPFLPRSVSAAGRLSADTSSPATQSVGPQSYRNAMMGNLRLNPSHSYSHPPSASMFLNQTSDSNNSSSSFSFGSQWMEMGVDQFSNDLPLPAGLSSMLADEFPHLDIINDLLDDEYYIPNAAAQVSPLFQSFSNGLTYPGGIIGGSVDHCGSTSPHDEFYRSYGGGQYELRQPNLHDYMNVGQVDGLIENQWRVGMGMGMGGCDVLHHNGYDEYTDYSNNDMMMMMMMGVNGYGVYRPNGQ